MIDDWVNKGHTIVNMFSVVGEQIRSLSSKQSKLNFWNRLHPKIAFLCRFWTQRVKWRLNHTIVTSSVKVILKAMIKCLLLETYHIKKEKHVEKTNLMIIYNKMYVHRNKHQRIYKWIFTQCSFSLFLFIFMCPGSL
jgi:hypothetical protein